MQDHTNDPVWKQAIAGSQMLLVAFGALTMLLVDAFKRRK